MEGGDRKTSNGNLCRHNHFRLFPLPGSFTHLQLGGCWELPLRTSPTYVFLISGGASETMMMKKKKGVSCCRWRCGDDESVRIASPLGENEEVVFR